MPQPLNPREAYRRWARTYDADNNLTRDLDALVLRRAGLPLEGAFVVELGAGTGKNTVFLAELARRVVALDLSAEMLERARAKVDDAVKMSFVEQDICERWPVADGEADIVVGNLVLEHVADLAPVFAEARRCLRAGGIFYLAELHPFRQLGGAVARFGDAGDETQIQAFVHLASDYLHYAIKTGFSVRGMGEFNDAGRRKMTAGDVPRLLQLLFEAV